MPPDPSTSPSRHRTTSDEAPSVGSALVELAASLPADQVSYWGLEGAHRCDALPAVRSRAVLQDAAAFRLDHLPPALYHEDPRASAHRLYGGTAASPVPMASYHGGSFAEKHHRHHKTIYGAAIFDAGEGALAMPALVYKWEPPGSQGPVLVCHVHEAPLAALEAQLFDESASITPLERATRPEGMAEQLHTLSTRTTGAFVRSAPRGLDDLPGFLVEGDYHVVRPGPLPWLHLRAPTTDLELERLERLCASALLYNVHGNCGHNPDPPPGAEVGAEVELPSDEAPHRDKLALLPMRTVFERAPDEFAWFLKQPSASANERMCAEVARRADDAKALARAPISAMVAWAMLRECHYEEFLCRQEKGVHLLMHKTRTAQRARHESWLADQLEEASEMARAPALCNLSTLFAMVPGVSTLRQLAWCTSNQLMHEVSGALFSAVDAALAVRELNTHEDDADDDLPGTRSRPLRAMARRVAAPQAILIFDLHNGHLIQRMQLCNASYPPKDVGLDEAARLLTMPWVVPLAACNGIERPQGYLTIESSLVTRDTLHVSDAVRATFNVAPPVRPPPTVSPTDLAEFKSDVMEKLSAFTAEVGAIVAAKSATATVVHVAPDDAVTVRLRATQATLERLLRKRGADVDALSEA